MLAPLLGGENLVRFWQGGRQFGIELVEKRCQASRPLIRGLAKGIQFRFRIAEFVGEMQASQHGGAGRIQIATTACNG
jgi:hypothetical protein